MEASDYDRIDWDGVGERLRGVLALPDRSHRRFAAAAGVTPQALSKWLDGGRISPPRWSRVAAAAGLTVPELLGADGGPDADAQPGDVEALQLLRRLAALADEPMDRAVPDLMQVLRDAQGLVERTSPRSLPQARTRKAGSSAS